MSEEKLYVVKSAKGLYLSMRADALLRWREGQICATTSPRIAHDLCTEYGGHVVTLIEEPEKVTVSSNEAKAIESLLNADTYADVYDPFRYLFTSMHKEDIKRLIKAIKNGYTVAKEKKYNVKVPHADYTWYVKTPDGKLDTIWVKGLAKGFGGYPDGIELTNDDIENFGLQDCEKEEVTDDEQ